jgi:hypothetical protein
MRKHFVLAGITVALVVALCAWTMVAATGRDTARPKQVMSYLGMPGSFSPAQSFEPSW